MKHKPIRQHAGDPKSSADAHVSEPRASASLSGRQPAFPIVTNPEGLTLKTIVNLKHDALVVSLHETAHSGMRLLAFHVNQPSGVFISNVSEMMMAIDALYALGAAWQKQDQEPKESHGHE